MLVAALATVVSIIALGFALAWRSADQERLDRARKANCEQIEALKAEFRAEAIEDFSHLDRNAALLGIAVTPEVRAAAREARDDTLQRFAPAKC